MYLYVMMMMMYLSWRGGGKDVPFPFCVHGLTPMLGRAEGCLGVLVNVCGSGSWMHLGEGMPSWPASDVTAQERRRWEEGAINTQGVCAYLSRTIKWENGINALTMDLADMLLLKLLLLACLPDHNQGECGGLGTARKRAQVVLLKSAKRRMRRARKAASAVS